MLKIIGWHNRRVPTTSYSYSIYTLLILSFFGRLLYNNLQLELAIYDKTVINIPVIIIFSATIVERSPVVIIDNIALFKEQFETLDNGEWLDCKVRLLTIKNTIINNSVYLHVDIIQLAC